MKKTMRRTLAATAAGALAAGALATAPLAAAAAEQASAPERGSGFAKYGFKGTASGARLFANNVEVLSLNDGQAALRCTRKLDFGNEVSSPLSAPENSLIDLSASENSTKSYSRGDRVGVRAISKLGDITVGDVDLGTPTLTITGLRTVADSFHDKSSGYGHEESITRMNLDIELLPGQDPTDELDALINAIPEGLQPVLDVLEEVGAPIAIPDLGSIALSGRSKGGSNGHSAWSDAAALEIVVDATGETQKLLLGDVHSRVGGPAKASVFRSTSMPMAVDIAEGAVRMGHIKPRTIPCEGTNGRAVTKKLTSASVLLPEGLLAGISGVEYVSMGDMRKDGSAKGYQISRVGTFEIPGLDLTIEGITSRVGAKTSEPGGKVRKSSRTSVAKVTYEGKQIGADMGSGENMIVDGLGIIETGVVTDGNRFGKRVTALRLTLTEFGAPIVIDLGIAASRVYHY